jgi:hypothetical protein
MSDTVLQVVDPTTIVVEITTPGQILLVQQTSTSILEVEAEQGPTGPAGPAGPAGADGAGITDGELHLTPKASSTGSEGTVFYDSDDDHLWVATA